MYISIEEAISELKKEGIIAIPTETVYGLGGNALSEIACKKIFELKNRPFHNPLIVHVGAVSDLEKVARNIPEKAYKLAQHFWPGPLTLVLKKQNLIPDIVTGGLNTVAVRMPDHRVTLELLKNLSFPLAAPSANPFGSISPTKPDHVLNFFGGQIKVLDGGECLRGVESTIVGFDKLQNPVLYRHGSILVDDLREVVGDVQINTHEENKPNAPGMLSKHYSPRAHSRLTQNVRSTLKNISGQKTGLLLFKERITDHPELHQEILSEAGDLTEAAKNLYAAMHRLDERNPEIIIFEQFPEEGLGITINDKLRRAAKN